MSNIQVNAFVHSIDLNLENLPKQFVTIVRLNF